MGTAFVFVVGLIDDRYTLKAGPQLSTANHRRDHRRRHNRVYRQGHGARHRPVASAALDRLPHHPGVGDRHDEHRQFPGWARGLAAGVGVIAALSVCVPFPHLQQDEIAMYALALAAACLGFLVFNFNPARVFLGSAGAMTLGYALATLSILAPARVATALLVMAIPIVDTGFQAFDRWRRGQSPAPGRPGPLALPADGPRPIAAPDCAGLLGVLRGIWHAGATSSRRHFTSTSRLASWASSWWACWRCSAGARDHGSRRNPGGRVSEPAPTRIPPSAPSAASGPLKKPDQRREHRVEPDSDREGGGQRAHAASSG